MNEMTIAGPANCAAAGPGMTNMPDPMMAPMPMHKSCQRPSTGRNPDTPAGSISSVKGRVPWMLGRLEGDSRGVTVNRCRVCLRADGPGSTLTGGRCAASPFSGRGDSGAGGCTGPAPRSSPACAPAYTPKVRSNAAAVRSVCGSAGACCASATEAGDPVRLAVGCPQRLLPAELRVAFAGASCWQRTRGE
jgi:hypothetical protein